MWCDVCGGFALSVDCRVYIYWSLEEVLGKLTLKTVILFRLSMDFETNKHSRRQLIYYYSCGVDEDGLGAGSGSKNVKT